VQVDDVLNGFHRVFYLLHDLSEGRVGSGLGCGQLLLIIVTDNDVATLRDLDDRSRSTLVPSFLL
jgi:hypothetical protein